MSDQGPKAKADFALSDAQIVTTDTSSLVREG